MKTLFVFQEELEELFTKAQSVKISTPNTSLGLPSFKFTFKGKIKEVPKAYVTYYEELDESSITVANANQELFKLTPGMHRLLNIIDFSEIKILTTDLLEKLKNGSNKPLLIFKNDNQRFASNIQNSNVVFDYTTTAEIIKTKISHADNFYNGIGFKRLIPEVYVGENSISLWKTNNKGTKNFCYVFYNDGDLNLPKANSIVNEQYTILATDASMEQFVNILLNT